MMKCLSDGAAVARPRRLSVRKGSHSAHCIQRALRRIFGLTRLRPGQQEVIGRVLGGSNTLAVMPTGAGKSLCYQLPAVLLAGRTVVVSPLIALMKDQCESLVARGIKAVQVNSALDAETMRHAEAAILDGSARIVLTTPERLADGGFIGLLQQQPTSLLVVDEAHCISQWGHDFRPAFLEIAPAVKKLGKPAVLALTATATEAVTSDIISQLGIPKAGIFNTGAFRPNLHFSVEQVLREGDKLERVLALVRANSGSGLVYAATVRAADAVYEALLATGESVMRYHGKLGAAERHAAQEAFMAGTVRVMVATNAFGLGIDKPDIRFVLHYQMPAGLDAYYQEAGRAGRDGLTSQCVLLFLRSDKSVQQFFMGGRYPGLADVEALYRALLRDAPDSSGWTFAALQRELDRPLNKLKVAASLLRRQRIAAVRPGGELVALQRELDDAAFQALIAAYQGKRELDREALEGMVFYAQTGHCRWQVLLAHLQQQAEAPPCGHCDNCQRIDAVKTEMAARVQAHPAPAAGAAPVPACPPGAATGLPIGALQHATGGPAIAGFKPDQLVKVKRYGIGRVVATDGLSVTVEFAAGPRRSFQADYVQRARERPQPETGGLRAGAENPV